MSVAERKILVITNKITVEVEREREKCSPLMFTAISFIFIVEVLFLLEPFLILTHFS